MKKSATITLAGLVMAATIAASVGEASAHRARYHHGHQNHVYHPGAAIATGALFGLAIGVASASLWAPYPAYPPAYAPAPYPTENRYQPAQYAPTHARWCASQYPGYRAADNTWVDHQGLAQICYSPF